MADLATIKRIKELTVQLNQYCDEYYNQSRPSVSDAEFDALFDELKKLENESGFYCTNSPTKNVGHKVSDKLPKVKHTYPLLSLDKTKDYNEAATYTKGKEALLMHKLDGLTICLTYDKGKLVEASTRGNGEEGSLITENAKTFMNLPSTIPFEGCLKITGEGIIHRDDFEKINAAIPNEDDKYKTPRNLAGGSVQQLDPSICATRKVYFYAFNVIKGMEETHSLSGRLEQIREYGFDICKYITYKPKTHDFEMFKKMVGGLVLTAERKSIPIDGLVVMYDDIVYGNSLGRTGHHYRNGIALKFQEEEEESVIQNVEWQVGRTGKITPVAIFKTVILDNTNVNKASLHNLSVMEKLGIRKHATVTVVKKNEIIPQIIKSVGGKEKFEVPVVCPVCKKPTIIKDENGTAQLYCENDECLAKSIQTLAYFVSKDCMDIDGLSEKSLEKFVEAGLIKNVYDIYDLKSYHDEIVEFEGMGENSFNKLVESIEKSRTVKLENFIAALGIQNVALSKAKAISKHFNGSWNEFKNACDKGFDFTQLNGFGVEINKNIYKFWKDEYYGTEYYRKLAELMTFVIDEVTVEQKLKDMTIVITGTLNTISRKELQEKIENLGGKVAGSVSKKTTYLINNDKESTSSKNVSAKKNNVPIITEDEFLNLINKQE